MELTDIDKKNIEKMYKKYGQKLVSKIVKKQDKLKMSESLRSTIRKMRKQEGGNPDPEGVLNLRPQSCGDIEPKCKKDYCLKHYSMFDSVCSKVLNKVTKPGRCLRFNHKRGTCIEREPFETVTVYEYDLSKKQKKKCEEKSKDYSCDDLTKQLSILNENDILKTGFETFIINEKINFKKELLIKLNSPDCPAWRKNEVFNSKLKKYFNKKIFNSEEPSILKGELKKILAPVYENFDQVKSVDIFYLDDTFVKNLTNFADAFTNAIKDGNEYPILNENPDSEENLSLKYNPNFQPMQQLPVAVQPVAVQPVAVQPVAVQPVGVQPVAVQQPVTQQ